MESKIIIADSTAETTATHHGTVYTNSIPLSISPSKAFKITTSRAITPVPSSKPEGMPIIPSTKPSKSTLCLICFEVAPIEASIP